MSQARKFLFAAAFLLLHCTLYPHEISIRLKEKLEIRVQSENLVIESLKCSDIPAMQELRAKEENMSLFANRNPVSKEKTLLRCINWIKRWESGNPFSAMSIFTREGEFIGYAVMGYGDDPDTGEENAPGLSEFAIIIDSDYWGLGYGTEAAGVMLFKLAPELKDKKFSLSGAPLQRVIFTTSPDNPGMVRLCEKLGIGIQRTFGPNEPGNPWNFEKYFYELEI
ncbi:MAG: GNAT family N-acetyltransferase [Candidatus Algichlamydia australiensis]|nr:GNAT family N-acetyltransferase [Chlamydiales bacterium]